MATLTVEDGLRGLQKALALGDNDYTLEDLSLAIRNGQAQLFEREDACIVSEIRDTPRARYLHFWLATGRMQPVIELSRDVLAWGRLNGAGRATLLGRKGWLRVLEREGWTPSKLIVMTQEL